MSDEHLADIQPALEKVKGADRRAFQAEIALKYCNGSARNAETHFGWSRKIVMLGLAEKCSGLIGVGAQAVFSRTNAWKTSNLTWPQFYGTQQNPIGSKTLHLRAVLPSLASPQAGH